MNIDRVEGRRHALNAFVSVEGVSDNFFKVSGAETILDNLRASALQRHGQYAAGMNDIIEAAAKIIEQEIQHGH